MSEPTIQEKAWQKEFETAIWQKWKTEEPYAFHKDTKKKIYSIDTPPPYVNTPVHIGHATTYVLMDMFARYRRMQGYEVLFPLGLDRNGLPIEMAAEKKFNIRMHHLTREEFIAKCKQLLEEASLASLDTFAQCGIGFNSWHVGTGLGEIYQTDSPDYRALTQATFIDLWKRGLIYEEDRINNYCPGCRTTLADAEVIYEDKPSSFNHILFTVKETGEKITIGTTRPELICTCAMIIYHPDDARYKHLAGKKAITPVFNKEVPIQAHPLAQIDKGTGLVMMCSAGDLSDIRFFREMNLDPVIAINQDGTMNEHAGFLKGLKVRDARAKIIEELKAQGLLVTSEQTIHRTPICERSKHEIEFINMREFYLKQLPYKDDMRAIAKKLKIYAPESSKILEDWIDSISIDWPISRRRYYATEVPLWYCKHCKEPVLPKKGTYHQPWKEPAPASKCPKCSNKEFIGEERVFDTWFDSSISPLYILQYERDTPFFKKARPCTLRPQGKEIVRTWLYYTLLKCYLLTGKSIFKEVWIHHHIVDNSGKKMSKSIGNVINPQDILKRYGSEPLRLWAAVEGNLEKTDFRCSYDRIDGAGKTLTKFWNVTRFISSFEKPAHAPATLEPLDQWIITELNALITLSTKHYEKYDFHNPAIAIRHFIWETFASHYLELVKSRAYNKDNQFTKDQHDSACYTLHYILETLLKLLAPITPIFAFILYEKLLHKDIHFETFPAVHHKLKTPIKTQDLINLNSSLWKMKKDQNMSLNAPVAKATIPSKFASIKTDLQTTHRITDMHFGKKISVAF